MVPFQKVATMFLALIWQMALSAPVQIIRQDADNNAAGSFQFYQDTNNSALPFSDDFKSTGNTLYFQPDRDDQDNDNDGYKGHFRPFFTGETLGSNSHASREQQLADVLDYVGFLLDHPYRELTAGLLNSAVTEISRLINELYTQAIDHQDWLMSYLQIGSTSEEQWRFRHHPGFQPEHPAHPHQKVDPVPGIISAPVKKGEGKKTGQAAKARTSGKGGKTTSTHQASQGISGGAGSSEGAPGGGDDPPSNKKRKNLSVAVSETQEVSMEITVNNETYNVTAELSGNDLKLFCPICIGLISGDASQCLGCTHYICRSELGQIACCPICRQKKKSFSDVNLKSDIVNLKWHCPLGCGRDYDLSSLKIHIPQCRPTDVFTCENQNCEYTGTYDEVEAHEADCVWRLVEWGAHQLPVWKKEIIEQVPPVDDLDTMQPADVDQYAPAVLATSLLIQLVVSQPSASETVIPAQVSLFQEPLFQEPLFQQCLGCQRPYLTSDIVAHCQHCEELWVDCNYCHQSLKQGLLENHQSEECVANLNACVLGCGLQIAVKDMGQHADEKCSNRLVTCPYRGCPEKIVFSELQEHKASMHRQGMPQHTALCRSKWEFDGRRIVRQEGEGFPVYYHSANIAYIVIPTSLIKKSGKHRLPLIRFRRETLEGALLCYDGKNLSALKHIFPSSREITADCLNMDGRVLFSYQSAIWNGNKIGRCLFDYGFCESLPSLPKEGHVVLKLQLLDEK